MITSGFQRDIVAKGLIPDGIDPRHVEGYIRLEYATLNQLSWPTIRREVKIGIACIREAGAEAAEQNAQSFGL